MRIVLNIREILDAFLLWQDVWGGDNTVTLYPNRIRIIILLSEVPGSQFPSHINSRLSQAKKITAGVERNESLVRSRVEKVSYANRSVSLRMTITQLLQFNKSFDF